MKRRLFTLLAGLSMALFLATCWAWFHYRGNEYATMFLPWPHDAHYFVSVDSGRITDGWWLGLKPPPEATTLQWARSRPMFRWKWLGFEYANGEEVPYVDMFSVGRRTFVHEYYRTRYVTAPVWAFATALLVLPLMWLRARHRQWQAAKRIGENRCRVCGYDLRATPACCPECGTTPLSRRDGSH